RTRGPFHLFETRKGPLASARTPWLRAHANAVTSLTKGKKKNPRGEALGVCERPCRLSERVGHTDADRFDIDVEPAGSGLGVVLLEIVHVVDRAREVTGEGVLCAGAVRPASLGIAAARRVAAEIDFRAGKPNQAVKIHGADVDVRLGEYRPHGGP